MGETYFKMKGLKIGISRQPLLRSGSPALPAVIQRCLPVRFLKQTVEMAAVGKSQFVNNGRNTSVSSGEKDLRFLKIDGLPVFQDCFAGIFLHDPVQILSVVVQLG